MLKKFNLPFNQENDYFCLEYDTKRLKLLKKVVECDYKYK